MGPVGKFRSSFRVFVCSVSVYCGSGCLSNGGDFLKVFRSFTRVVNGRFKLFNVFFYSAFGFAWTACTCFYRCMSRVLKVSQGFSKLSS